MVDVTLVKLPDGSLRPATVDDAERLECVPAGREVGVTIVVPRDGKYHRKVMSLLGLMYDIMPHTINSFERFRQEAVIACGFYHTEVTGDGTIRIVAQSLSYKDCSQDLIEHIYDRLLDFAISRMQEYDDRESIEQTINELVKYA